MAGKPKIYILTSAGFKKEGEEFQCSFSYPEAAWAAYADEFGRFVTEFFERKRRKKFRGIEWLTEPKLVSYDIRRFNSGNGILKKKAFNIYSRFKLKND